MEGETGALKSLVGRRGDGGQHHDRLVGSDGGHVDPGPRPPAVCRGNLAGRHQQRSRAIADRTGIASKQGARRRRIIGFWRRGPNAGSDAVRVGRWPSRPGLQPRGRRQAASGDAIPALLTSTSTRPYIVIASPTRRSHPLGSTMSVSTASAGCPPASARPAMSARRAARRAPSTTSTAALREKADESMVFDLTLPIIRCGPALPGTRQIRRKRAARACPPPMHIVTTPCSRS